MKKMEAWTNKCAEKLSDELKKKMKGIGGWTDRRMDAYKINIKSVKQVFFQTFFFFTPGQ